MHFVHTGFGELSRSAKKHNNDNNNNSKDIRGKAACITKL